MSTDSHHRQRLGRWGEQVAATQLEAEGYAILERNWRGDAGEVDLVARHGETIVFVEVKTRRGRGYGAPEQALTARKAERLQQLGIQYIIDHDLDGSAWRIDLVAVELDSQGKMLRCEHIPNAVLGW